MSMGLTDLAFSLTLSKNIKFVFPYIWHLPVWIWRRVLGRELWWVTCLNLDKFLHLTVIKRGSCDHSSTAFWFLDIVNGLSN